MKSKKGPPNPRPSGVERIVGIGGSSIGNAFGDGSYVVNIGGDNYGTVGVTLTNCLNMIAQEESDQRRELLEQLQLDVRSLLENLPAEHEDDGPRIADNLEILTKQATSDKPNRKWYSLSAEELLEAAQWVKNFTGNISRSILNLGKLIWPDYSLPESGG